MKIQIAAVVLVAAASSFGAVVTFDNAATYDPGTTSATFTITASAAPDSTAGFRNVANLALGVDNGATLSFDFTGNTLPGGANTAYAGGKINLYYLTPVDVPNGTVLGTVTVSGLQNNKTYNLSVTGGGLGYYDENEDSVMPSAAIGSSQFTVTLEPGSPTIATIPDASISAPNAYTGPTPPLTQGTPPVTWSLLAGPADMTIDADTGVVSWPASTVTGSPHTITIEATNGLGSDTETWQLTVTPAVSPVIAAIPDASIQAPNAYAGPTPSLTQGTSVVTWSLMESPAGMTIDADTGVVSWSTSTITGSPHTITIQATNTAGSATQTWQLTVTPAPVIPVIAAIPDGSVQAPHPYTGPTPSLTQGTLPVTWSLVAGPTGIGVNSQTGQVFWGEAVVTGSPHTITIQATNGAGSATESWQLTVIPAVIPAIAAIPDASIQEPDAYTGPTPSLTQGTPVVTWSLVEGPKGLMIDPLTGEVYWPISTTTDSPHTITIRATNSAGSATQTWRLTVTPIPVKPLIAAIPDASIQAPNAYTGPTPSLMQGTLPVTWSLVTGPSGMTIDAETGVVSWPTSTAVGSPFTITIRATNSEGSRTQTWHLTTTVEPSVSPVIADIPDASIQAPNAYTGPTPELTQGTLPVAWSLVAGPSGMTIDAETGVVSWPTSSIDGSPRTITIQAANSAGSATQSWELTITPPGSIDPTGTPICGRGGSENLPAVGVICLLSLMLGRRFVGSRR